MGLIALAFSAADAAWARTPIDGRLADSEEAVLSISKKADDLHRQASPGRGFITEAQAVQRYQDSVYLYFVGQYEQAAEGFFTLVTTGALSDPGFDRDAEWYLAESLLSMGNLQDAEASFLVISHDDGHPFREDAVRRLLEIFAATEQSEKFSEVYQREIVSGKVAPSDLITYAVGKGFFQQGQFAQAKSHLGQIPDDSPYYRKARYFLGAILIAEQGRDGVDDAVPYFEELVSYPVETAEDRQVYDLSLLALGRLNYERGDFAKAAEWYDKIGGDSEFLADKLYEIIWTYIKRDDAKRRAEAAEGGPPLGVVADSGLQSALRGVEIFLLAFPEHRYTAQLQLLKGHLHYREQEYAEALSSYNEVIAAYTPVGDRFRELSASVDDPKDYFQRILALDTAGPGDESGLPSYAVAMMMADDELGRAITVYRDLEREDLTLDASERLIDELNAIIGTEATIGGFEYLRYDVVLQQGLALEQQLALLALQEEWLLGAAGDSPPLELNALTQRRLELDSQARSATARVEALWAELESTRERAARQRGDRDALLESRERATSRVMEIERKLAEPGVSPADRTSLEDQLVVQRNDLAEVDADLRSMDAERDLERALLSLEQESSATIARVDEAIRELKTQYDAFLHLAPVAERTEVGARFTSMHDSLARSLVRLRDVQLRLEDIESSELGRIRQRFAAEVEEVRKQRKEHAEVWERAEGVSVALTRGGFERLASFFAESVLRADMGIVDVFWTEKQEVAQQAKEVRDERAELVADLERRFALIRQKLEQ